jgi:glycosyltransferase involved in cell wall biosynthesis
MAAAGIEVLVRDGSKTDQLAALRWLDRQVREWRPTHLWTSLTRATLLGQLIGWRRRVPVVSWQHNAFLRPINLRLLRATQRLSRLWIGDSDSVTRLTAERLGVGPDRLTSWPIFRADPDAPRASPWREGEPLRIGSLGRLHPAKGYDVLIEALALLRTDVAFEVAVAGDGEAHAALQAQAVAAGVKTLRLAGYAAVPRDFLAGLHLYLQPSRREGLCIAAHQAMQAGLPVIASAVGELPFSIEAGVTGWSVPPGDAAALATALGEALAEPARLAAMGEAARDRVLSRFGPERFDAIGLAIVERLRTITRLGRA